MTDAMNADRTKAATQWEQLMQSAPPVLAKMPEMPRPEVGPAELWHAAISGKGAQIGMAENKRCGDSWLEMVGQHKPAVVVDGTRHEPAQPPADAAPKAAPAGAAGTLIPVEQLTEEPPFIVAHRARSKK